MIKIISTEDDVSTNKIIEFLLGKSAIFERVNTEDYTKTSVYLDNSKNITLQNNTFHRRGRINSIPPNVKNSIFGTYIANEENPVIKAIEYISKAENYNYVGEYNEEEQHNKLIDLYIAKSLGFLIPKTLISNSKLEVLNFYENCNQKMITKCIKYPLYIKTKDFSLYGKHTFVVNKKLISQLSENHSLGLYQEFIEKKYEIRIFVYKDKIYPMAIFSQKNKKTKIDYRNYDHDKPNRCVPYELPKEILNKIIAFFKFKKINTGSIDLIYTLDGRYIFLENNPQGQFDWLSKNCNYHIEKAIADDLIVNQTK